MRKCGGTPKSLRDHLERLKILSLMLSGFHEAYSATSKDWQELAEPGAGSRGASLP